MGVGACLCLCCWGFLCCVVSCVCVCVCVCLGPSLVRGLSIEPLIPQGGIPHPRVQGEATPQRALAPPGEWPPLRVCGVFSRGFTQGATQGRTQGAPHPGYLKITQGFNKYDGIPCSPSCRHFWLKVPGESISFLSLVRLTASPPPPPLPGNEVRASLLQDKPGQQKKKKGGWEDAPEDAGRKAKGTL